MLGQLVTLPLRLTVRTASLFLRGSEEVLKRALALTGHPVEAQPSYDTDTVHADQSFDENGASPASATETVEREAESDVAQDAPSADAETVPASPAPAQPEPPSTPLVEEPTHVSEEPTVVEELAEPGAEDGAGAQVRIDEPWEGYAKLNAQDVIARLSEADPAELAAVSLYESANQARQTVLSAAERQLQLANRRGTTN